MPAQKLSNYIINFVAKYCLKRQQTIYLKMPKCIQHEQFVFKYKETWPAAESKITMLKDHKRNVKTND